jgi:hypothetical protein
VGALAVALTALALLLTLFVSQIYTSATDTPPGEGGAAIISLASLASGSTGFVAGVTAVALGDRSPATLSVVGLGAFVLAALALIG